MRVPGGGPMVRRGGDPMGSPQWWAKVVGSIGLVLLIAGPVASLAGMPLLAVLDAPAVAWVGFALALLGIVATRIAQSTLGASWRGDVDPDVRTDLITTGLYRWVRNPILTATQITAAGIVLLAPNVLSIAALACVVVSHQILVRLVEEPYLEGVHGAAYRAYAASTGRFVPGIGRLRTGD